MPIRCCYKPGHHFPAEPPDLPGQVYWIRANTNLVLTGSREGTGLGDAATGDTACAPGDNQPRPASPPRLLLIRCLRNLRRSSLVTMIKFAEAEELPPSASPRPVGMSLLSAAPRSCRGGTAAPRLPGLSIFIFHTPITPLLPPFHHLCITREPVSIHGAKPRNRNQHTSNRNDIKTTSQNADNTAFSIFLVPKPAWKAILFAVPIKKG